MRTLLLMFRGSRCSNNIEPFAVHGSDRAGVSRRSRRCHRCRHPGC